MSQINKYFIIFFIFVLYNITYSQILKTKDLKQEQIYLYKDDNINLKYWINQIIFSNNDTLIINIELKNVSQSNIFMFENYKFIKKRDKDGIIIDYGGSFTSNIVYDVKLNALKPDSIKINKKYFMVSDLLNESFNGYINLPVDLGYLTNIEDLINSYKNNLNEKIDFNSDSIIIESDIIELFLYRIPYGNLYIFIKN